MNNSEKQNETKPQDEKKKTTRKKIRPKRPAGDPKNQKQGMPEGMENFDWKKASKTPMIWIFLIISVIILANMMASTNIGEQEITFTQFQDYVDNGIVLKGEIIGPQFHGVLKESQTMIVASKEYSFNKFVMTLPFVDNEMIAKWDEMGIQYTFKERTTNWTDVLINFIPWVLILGLWIFWMKRLQGGGAGGGKGIFSFGKSPARMLNPDHPKTTFSDVAGCDEAKFELQEIIEFLKDPEKFQTLGGRIPKGALLLGPPGTGKTLLAKAAAGEAGAPFFSISGADFVEMFVGVGASRVRDLFEQAQKNSPCIVFIDEIDAVGRQRGAGLGGGHDEREQTLNQLLVQMDGFEPNTSIIVLAATNRPDILDKALLRPGRFDRQIIVDVPDVKGREGILKVHVKNIKINKNVDLSILAKGTPGLVGADLANLVNEAALLAARHNKKSVEMIDLEEAKDKVMMGTERRSMIINDAEKKVTAYHEAGHAIAGLMNPDADPIHKVTIIPRGRALGVTHTLPTDEKHNYPKSFIILQLDILMGGRTAEEIIFDDITTGAGNDIERATDLAKKMVCEWGMSTRLGPLTFGKKNEEIFLGREFARSSEHSNETSKIIDEEIATLVKDAHKRTTDLLTKHIDLLHAIANELLEKEILDRNELLELVRKYENGGEASESTEGNETTPENEDTPAE